MYRVFLVGDTKTIRVEEDYAVIIDEFVLGGDVGYVLTSNGDVLKFSSNGNDARILYVKMSSVRLASELHSEYHTPVVEITYPKLHWVAFTEERPVWLEGSE